MGPPSGTFLDNLDTWFALSRLGIPGRGVRRQRHRVLFTSARVLGWFDDRDRVAQEWKVVLASSPGRIGCSVAEGVKDLLGHWESVRREPFRLWLPDCSKLPELDEGRRGILRQRLADFDCPVPLVRPVAAIVAGVLWRFVRLCPVACMEGRATIRARSLQVHAGRKLPACRRWLSTRYLLEVRDRHYVAGRRSRSYFVNLPLIVWLAGFRTEDIDWEPAGEREVTNSDVPSLDETTTGRIAPVLPGSPVLDRVAP